MKLHVIAITLAIFLIISCTPQSQETIKIGAVFHLTGPAAFWGSGEQRAAELAIEEINLAGGIGGKKLELITEDTKTDFVQTTNSLRKLIDIDDVPVIIGPTWFGQAAAPIAEDAKTVIVSPSTGVTVSREKYFFNLWPTERQEIIPLVECIKKQNHQKIAVVYSQNDWSVSMKDNFVNEANKKGLVIVKEFATTPGETDFKTVIAKLKGLEIDAVYAPFAFYPSQGSFSKQAKELQLNLPLYSSSGTENPELLKASPEIEGTIYPYPLRVPREAEFVKKYEEKFGIPAAPSVAYAYDAVNLIADALSSGAITSDEIAEYLKSIQDYEGASNTITFENGRVTHKEHLIKTIKNGKFIEVE